MVSVIKLIVIAPLKSARHKANFQINQIIIKQPFCAA
jgi:hypothetical protein